MPRSSPSRDRLLRYILGTNAQGVALPDAYEEPLASLYALSKRTDVAVSWVQKVCHELEDSGFIELEDQIRVTDAWGLIDWWSDHRTQPERHGLHLQDPAEAIGHLVHEDEIPLAVTSYYAENAYQAHLFPRQMEAYVREADYPDARAALVEQGGKLGGANLRLLTGDDAIVDEAVPIGEGKATIPYAPAPQVILDLISIGGSAREAADMLIARSYPDARTGL